MPKILIHKPTLKRLAAEGWSERQIAGHFGCVQSAVHQACARLGIRCRGKLGTRSKRGLSPGTLEYLRLRGPIAAARMGWPQARTAGEARVLARLLRGPATLAEIAGRRPQSLDHRRMKALRERGLVAATRIGRRLLLWRLADGVSPVGLTPESRCFEHTCREPRRGREVV